MAEKKSFKINDDAFNTETYSGYNGQVVKSALDQNDNHITGRSGKTKAYDTTNGGRLFLHDGQVTPV